MAFSKQYANVLLPFVQKYQDAKNEKGRAGVLKGAAEAVSKSKETMEVGGADLPKDLKAVRDLLF
jgi:hypothetical protein